MPVLRTHYIFNLAFWVKTSRLNQYSLRQSLSTGSDEVTLNKFLETITYIAQEQPHFS